LKLLLVDDHPSNLLALVAVVASNQYTLITAATGLEAIEKVKSNDFALILLDVQMPGLDGFQTAKKIKELDRGKSVPIIFVTATYKEDPFFLKGYEVGAVDYFGKPFNPEILKAKVRIYTELHEKNARLIEQERQLAKTEALLQEERKLKAVLEKVSEGVFIADADGKITLTNEEAMRIWGGARYVDFSRYEDYKGWWASNGERVRAEDWALSRALKKGESSTNERINIEAFDGTKKTILNSASPLKDSHGKIVGAVAVIQEVKDRPVSYA
jgi:DNA-binding response OmpR family regulator